MKTIDWPRILANPDAYAEHWTRLDERISHWPALCELCQIDPYGIAGFDLGLMRLVRDFFLVVKAREWDTAEAMYDEIMALRAQLQENMGITIPTKPQPVGC